MYRKFATTAFSKQRLNREPLVLWKSKSGCSMFFRCMLVKSWKVRPLCFQVISTRLEGEICGRENVADYSLTSHVF
ncbi:hypothetical protein OIU79_000787 [Salix purpurea]|uniref:Uncharacterized protein n=1 Tax=Salix purpurea TaxID=77065 RepID=A0A9Q0V260_SALPP|nr:hypothetical protein OIU79_000787 [Salix purpurea]